jgi:hypothetical protein
LLGGGRAYCIGNLCESNMIVMDNLLKVAFREAWEQVRHWVRLDGRSYVGDLKGREEPFLRVAETRCKGRRIMEGSVSI